MKHLFKIFLLTFGSILFLILDIQGQLLSPEMGTIIVTYQTNPAGQRLDRIRFWLINDQQERTLYPKKDEFVSNSHTPNERTVVITHLPSGNYRIEFLIPNTDQLFEELFPRQVVLASGSVVKIDQTIRHRSLPFHSSLSEKLDKSKPITLTFINQENPSSLKDKEKPEKSKRKAPIMSKQENPIFSPRALFPLRRPSTPSLIHNSLN